MALNPQSCANNLWELLQGVACLKPDGTPKSADAEPTGDFASGFAATYNDYVSNGVINATINTGGDTSILESASRSQSSITPADFALAMAQYWATVGLVPGDPFHGGTSVVSVTNNAMAHVSTFLNAIESSMTNEERTPYFLHYIENLESATKSITWLVTEMMSSGSPAVFEVTIE